MSSEMSRCAMHMFDQGHCSRLNIVRLYCVSALYLLNLCWDLQITLHKCQVWWVDVQFACLTKVGSRSRSQFKIKQCMTVCHVHLVSFENLVGFTKNSAKNSFMMSRCAIRMFDSGQFKFKVKHYMNVLHVRSITNGARVSDILKWLGTNVKNHAERMLYHGQLKVKVIVRSNTLSCSLYIL